MVDGGLVVSNGVCNAPDPNIVYLKLALTVYNFKIVYNYYNTRFHGFWFN